MLESRGSKVHLMHMPYVEAFDVHSFAKRTRIPIAGNDSFDCPNCIDLRDLVDRDQLRWPDGVHLDDRSAALDVRALEARVAPDLR